MVPQPWLPGLQGPHSCESWGALETALFAQGSSQGQVPAQGKQNHVKGGRHLVTAKKLCSLLSLLGVLLLGLSLQSGKDEQEGRVVEFKASFNVRMSNEDSTLSLCHTSAFCPPLQ